MHFAPSMIMYKPVRVSFPVVYIGPEGVPNRVELHYVVHSGMAYKGHSYFEYGGRGGVFLDRLCQIDIEPWLLSPGYYTLPNGPVSGQSLELAIVLAGLGYDNWCASGDLQGTEICAIGFAEHKRQVMTRPYILATPNGLEVKP